MNMYLLTTNYLKVSMPARAIANQKIVWHTQIRDKVTCFDNNRLETWNEELHLVVTSHAKNFQHN